MQGEPPFPFSGEQGEGHDQLRQAGGSKIKRPTESLGIQDSPKNRFQKSGELRPINTLEKFDYFDTRFAGQKNIKSRIHSKSTENIPKSTRDLVAISNETIGKKAFKDTPDHFPYLPSQRQEKLSSQFQIQKDLYQSKRSKVSSNAIIFNRNVKSPNLGPPIRTAIYLDNDHVSKCPELSSDSDIFKTLKPRNTSELKILKSSKSNDFIPSDCSRKLKSINLVDSNVFSADEPPVFRGSYVLPVERDIHLENEEKIDNTSELDSNISPSIEDEASAVRMDKRPGTNYSSSDSKNGSCGFERRAKDGLITLNDDTNNLENMTFELKKKQFKLHCVNMSNVKIHWENSPLAASFETGFIKLVIASKTHGIEVPKKWCIINYSEIRQSYLYSDLVKGCFLELVLDSVSEDMRKIFNPSDTEPYLLRLTLLDGENMARFEESLSGLRRQFLKLFKPHTYNVNFKPDPKITKKASGYKDDIYFGGNRLSKSPLVDFERKAYTRSASRQLSTDFSNQNFSSDLIEVDQVNSKITVSGIPDLQMNPELLFIYPPNSSDAVSITSNEVLRLRDGIYLNDSLIDFDLRLIMDETINESPVKNMTHIFSSFFFQKLSNTEFNPESDARLKNRQCLSSLTRVNIFDKQLVLLPINEHLHWYLVLILNPSACLKTINNQIKNKSKLDSEPSRPGTDIEPISLDEPISTPDYRHSFTPTSESGESSNETLERQTCIVVFDSLNSKYRARTIDKIKQFIVSEALVKKNKVIERKSIKAIYAKTPLQVNLTDCGCYLLETAEKLLLNPDELVDKIINRRSMNDLFTAEKAKIRRTLIKSRIEHFSSIYGKNARNQYSENVEKEAPASSDIEELTETQHMASIVIN